MTDHTYTPRVELVRDMTEREYHSDPCPIPSLSSSIAKVIDQQSLAHAELKHPKLGGLKPLAVTKEKSRNELDRGTIIHKMLLGKGEEICRLPFDNYRTKEAQVSRNGARSRGEIPILECQFSELGVAYNAIRARLDDFGLSFGTDTEVSAFWVQDEVQCRARLDEIQCGDRIVITDLKSTRDARPEACERTISNFGYDLQSATYIDAIEHVMPEFAGRVDFQWVFVELEPPYAVTPMTPSEDMAMIGKAKWDAARERWKGAISSGEWPCYVTQPVEAQVTQWELRQFHEEGAA